VTPSDFCYWLKGHFELNEKDELTSSQIQLIRQHLGLVFQEKAKDIETPFPTIKPPYAPTTPNDWKRYLYHPDEWHGGWYNRGAWGNWEAYNKPEETKLFSQVDWGKAVLDIKDQPEGSC
jgi:hypothetical protein